MKTSFLSLITIFLAAAALAQTDIPIPTDLRSLASALTLTVDSTPKKPTSGTKDRLFYTSLNLAVKTSCQIQTNFSLDVFFLVFGKDDGVKVKDKQVRELTLSPGSPEVLNFHANDVRDGTKFVYNWSGWIVRLSSGRTPIKVLASSPALERLARDPNRMAALEDGNTVPLK